jgi:hypothetical protein
MQLASIGVVGAIIGAALVVAPAQANQLSPASARGALTARFGPPVG